MINGEEIQDENDNLVDTDYSDVIGNIFNLTESFGVLNEYDSQLLSKPRQAKLAKMKRQIFDALSFYCDKLPKEENEKE